MLKDRTLPASTSERMPFPRSEEEAVASWGAVAACNSPSQSGGDEVGTAVVFCGAEVGAACAGGHTDANVYNMVGGTEKLRNNPYEGPTKGVASMF